MPQIAITKSTVLWILLIPPYAGGLLYFLEKSSFIGLVGFMLTYIREIFFFINTAALLGYRIEIEISKRKLESKSNEINIQAKLRYEATVRENEILQEKLKTVQTDLNSLDRIFRQMTKEHTDMRIKVEVLGILKNLDDEK